MRGNVRWGAITAALGLLLGLIGIGAPTAGAVVGGYVEVHARICPPGYAGDSYFDDCHQTPRTGVAYAASGPAGLYQEAVTDAAGNVVFGDVVEAGTVTIAEMVPSGEYAQYVVYCSRVDNNAPVAFEYRGNGRAAVAFEMPADIVQAGGGIVCDWYNVPAATVDPVDPVGTLELVKLACEGDPGTEIVVFTPLDVAGGLAEAGHDQCRGATASFQIIPFGDPSLEPIWYDAAVGVNSLTLPVGDHTLVELGTGAAATFPIQELATSRVFVLNQYPAEVSPPPPSQTPTPAPDLPTTLPSTGTGPIDASPDSERTMLTAAAGVLAAAAALLVYGTTRRVVH
jgi:hypothetical protein